MNIMEVGENVAVVQGPSLRGVMRDVDYLLGSGWTLLGPVSTFQVGRNKATGSGDSRPSVDRVYINRYIVTLVKTMLGSDEEASSSMVE